jgi:AcrR family transcriptional regulator
MDKRRQILEAAERVFRSKGLSKTTTREIARDAGCAEGTLYLHFDDRVALFCAVLDECLPDVKEPLYQLKDLVGKRTVRLNLEMVVAAYLSLHQRIQAAICSIFAEPELLQTYRERLIERGKGPHISEGILIDYIRAEQRICRIGRRAAPEAISSMLLGACFYRVMIARFMGEPLQPAPEVFTRNLVDTLLRGARPTKATVPESDPEPEFSYADSSVPSLEPEPLLTHSS